jgi:NAD(P)H-hydrate repair Nnr-like enzyme with NAD(P)H-hydrate dehydratase domain
LVVAGGRETPGAALLAAESSLRSGAGKLQVATVASLAPAVAVATPEALVIALRETAAGGPAPDCAEALAGRIERCDALLLGPGLPEDENTSKLTRRIVDGLAPDGPALVLDAAALSGLMELAGRLRSLNGRVVLTPHAGEMATLVGAIEGGGGGGAACDRA